MVRSYGDGNGATRIDSFVRQAVSTPTGATPISKDPSRNRSWSAIESAGTYRWRAPYEALRLKER
jgi:hypothetical protein